MKLKRGVLIYTLLCNIPVCFFLCLGSAIAAATNIESMVLTIDFNSLDWLSLLWNFCIAYVLAFCVGYFVPLCSIGRWFAALFHVENKTYTGNVPYRLLATLISSIIFYFGITPILTVLNVWVFNLQWNQGLLNMIIQAPIMIVTGFVASLINDVWAYKIAHHYDPTL